MKRVAVILALVPMLLCACSGGGKSLAARLSRSATADHFVYFTDAHVDVRETDCTAAVLDSVLSVVPTRRVIFGGDATMTTSACRTKEDIDGSWRIFQDCIDAAHRHGCEFLLVRGNHETTTGTIDTTVKGFTYSQQHTYERVMAPAEGAEIVELGNGTCNYYFESPKSRLRYIVLDPYSSAEEDLEIRYGVAMEYAGAATDWLAKCIETLPEGWKAIIFIHQGMNRCTGIPDYSNCRGMLQIVNDNADKVAMVLHGHLHKDVETFENGVLHVATTSSNYGQAQANIFGRQRRERGTDSETAIDLVDIDLETASINMFRIGGGYSRLFNLEPIAIKAGQSVKLSSSLRNVSFWTVYDADGIHAKSWVNWEQDAYYSNRYASLDGDRICAKAPGEIVAVATDEQTKTREYIYYLCE